MRLKFGPILIRDVVGECPAGAERLANDLVKGPGRRKDRLVLDLARIAKTEGEALDRLAEQLRVYRDRIRVILPEAGEFAALALLFSIYR